MPRRFAVRLVLCAALGTLLPAPALGSPAASVSDEPICAAAATLIESDFPQRARRLVVAYMGPYADPCLGDAEEAADAAIKEAQRLASQAASKTSAEPAEARKLIDSALKTDKENVRAIRLSSFMAEPSRSETFGLRWEKVVNSLKPFQDAAIGFLVLFLGLLAVARLGTTLPIDWPRTGNGRRSLLWLGGLIAAALASFMLTFGIGGVDRPPSEWDWVAIPATGLLLAAAAVCLITTAMATRMRLRIDVRSSKGANEVATGEVIALLAELGAARPRGLEVLHGTDVTVLDGTPIAGTPEGKVVAALTRLWQLITGLTPWHVRVDEESPDLHSVVIARNGHTVASVVIHRDQLGLRSPIVRDESSDKKTSSGKPGAKSPEGSEASDDEKPEPGLPDLHRFAAAAVLTTLARHYEGFESLYGVSDWRSLGLYYVATTDYAGKANLDDQRAALARAIDIDPRNIPARIALRHSQDRESLDARVLDDYISWLLDTSGDRNLGGDHAYPLRLRLRMTLVATACNRQALADAAALSADTNDRLIDAGKSLIRELSRSDTGDAESLVRAMRPSAAASYLSLSVSLRGRARGKQARRAVRWLRHVHRFGPIGNYNYACFKAGKHVTLDKRRAPAAPSYGEAVKYLRLASAEPEHRAFMAEDPWLAELRERNAYRSEFLEPRRTDFLSLEPLSKRRDELHAAGIRTAEQLADVSDWRLARYLKVDVLAAQRLIRLGGLAKSMPEDLSDFQVEIADALLKEGVDSTARLEESVSEIGAAKLAAKLHKHIHDRCKEEPRLWRLTTWLRDVAA